MRPVSIACALEGVAMFSLALTGLILPSLSMSRMAGVTREWGIDTTSLMRMHTGADLGLAAGFLAVAWRPVPAFGVLAGCVLATMAHGAVHLVEQLRGGHPHDNLMMIGLLLAGPLVILLLYPWRLAWDRYRSADPGAPGWLFRLICLGNAGLMLGIGAYGVAMPSAALDLLAGHSAPWDPATVSLMRMHTATDLGVGFALLLVAYRPLNALPALMLGIMSNVAHMAVHVAEEIQSGHRQENLLPLLFLSGFSLGLALLYPWKTAIERYRE